MKITILLSEEEVRAVIEAKVNSEASKHGHHSDVNRKISFIPSTGLHGPKPLEDLKIEVLAEIETK